MKLLMLFVGLLFGASNVMAKAQVSVSFNAPEKFTDFKTEANLRLKDRAKLITQLTKLITGSTLAKIPKDYNMEIVIDNVDMAGTFLFGTSDLYRVVRDSDRIRIDFSYKLLDENGKLIEQSEVNLSTMNSRSFKHRSKKYKHSNFALEMPLFDEWLDTAF